MPNNSDEDSNQDNLEDAKEILQKLSVELQELYSYRDLFFEKHPVEMASEKNKLIEEKKNLLLEKFEDIDVDTQIPIQLRAQFHYLKGKCYNISPTYDSSAIQCLSKAVKLNPHMVSAWNELGECYWKNMNIKEAKASFEGALKHERNRLSLRCLSIIVRQERFGRKNETTDSVLKSVEMAKEAVTLDTKDGVSWTVLGNAYLCQFFIISQDPATLKLCMSAYKQAKLDPIAKGQPDLYYNEGVALKYEECYGEALESFMKASRLDPGWEPPQQALTELLQYLNDSQQLQRTRGKLKGKRIAQMIQSIDEKMLGEYGPSTFHTFGARKNVQLKLTRLDALQEGTNEGTVILGRVVGSIHNDNSVPFTFAIVDSSMSCVCVTVYNWAGGRGAIIGDAVCLPEPVVKTHKHSSDVVKYEFKSIRVNNPMLLLVNGRRVGRNQVASTLVTSTYEAQ